MAMNTATFAKGETIFKEGSSSTHAYFIKKGSVEISTIRDGQRLVLERVGAGRCFGEMAPILGEKRHATAVARDYTEVYLLDKAVVERLVADSNPLLRTITYALINRVKSLTETVAPQAAPSGVLVSFAKILELAARAANAPRKSKATDTISMSLLEMVDTLSITTSLPIFRVRSILRRMNDLNLIIVEGSDEHSRVRYDPDTIVGNATNIMLNMNTLITDRLHADIELMEIEELARLVGVDAERIYRKLADGELPKELFLFKKSEALELLHEKGRTFFEQRRIKKISELEGMADLEFVDLETLGTALTAMEAYNTALLLKGQPPTILDRALGSLSQRMGQVIRNTMEAIELVDEVRVAQLEQELIDRIKQIKNA
ncbi:cyclic nucleotide-binding domain-containing protein [Endothiovibrio diazotrophicus]